MSRASLGGNLERGDEIYARLFPQALEVLKPGGFVVVEIGYNMRDAGARPARPGLDGNRSHARFGRHSEGG